MKTKNMTTLHLTKSIGRQPLRRGVLLVPLALAWLALSPPARAHPYPPPDGGYPNNNTAEGDAALFDLTTGSNNTANGDAALSANTTGSYNTANGSGALALNTTGIGNTATGLQALAHNTTSFGNTADGYGALFKNTTGISNTANGTNALFNSTTGNYNTANGAGSLKANTTGGNNTANGFRALFSSTTGQLNIALGESAGQNLTTGSNNIDVGNPGAAAAESNIIRIGTVVAFTDLGGVIHPRHSETFIAGIHGVAVTGSTVVVNSGGQLGTAPSSARFKEQIKPMDKASEAILALKPVTFRYKPELDPKGVAQFGLVAEDVEKVNPDLVARDAEGKVYTVRYEAVNAMLLNEFLKQHRRVEDQETTITQLKSTAAKQETTITQLKCTVGKQEATIAQQQKGMEVLSASLKEQASQIQKVSDQLEVSKPAPQMVVNNQ
jgi:uncharacterized coiled-coil protein SlyX